MPNWSKGCLKVRGKAANVKKFVLEGLQPVDFFGNALGVVLMHILEHLKRKERRRRENERRNNPFIRRSSKERKRA